MWRKESRGSTRRNASRRGGSRGRRPRLRGGERKAVTEPWERKPEHKRNNPRSTMKGGPKRDHDFLTNRPYPTMIPGDSAISGSRATGATTSTTTRDCNRSIDEGRRPMEEPTMRRGEKSTTEATRRDREPKITEAKQRERREGTAAHEECRGCSSLRLRGVDITMKNSWC